MWISWGCMLLFAGISIVLLTTGESGVWFPLIFINAVWMITALFTVRGYRLEDRCLFIQRLLWETRLDLTGLEEAYAEPEAFRRGFKTLGNGGLFSFSGYYRSKTLGSFRCWVTDQKRSVVLVLKNKKMVVSPDSPESFLSALGFNK